MGTNQLCSREEIVMAVIGIRKAVVVFLVFLVIIPPLIVVLFASFSLYADSGENAALTALFLGFFSNCILMFWGWLAVLFSPSMTLSKKFLWAAGILLTGAICASLFLLRFSPRVDVDSKVP
jgi:hypothetical protein